MTARPRVGISLHSDLEFLEHAAPMIERAEVLEVTPETLWRPTDDGAGIRENDYHARFADLQQRRGIPFVAHGVELSPGSVEGGNVTSRTGRWLDQIRRDHETFHFEWYTEHLGYSAVGDLHCALPLPLPFAVEAVDACRDRLALVREIVPKVGFENSANYAFLGSVEHEPIFLNAVAGDDLHILLDLHNVYTECVNEGIDPIAYVDAIALDRVIEIHLAGGSMSEAAWLRTARTFRLDSHDGPVPDPVWQLFEHVLPRCRNLGAVIVERMTGTLDPERARGYEAELERAIATVEAAFADGPPAAPAPPTPPGRTVPPLAGGDLREVEEAFMALATSDQARADLERFREERPELQSVLGAIDGDALELTSLLVRKLRFERLLQGSREAGFWFSERPEEFAKVFGDYCRRVAPTAVFPSEEAALFEEWAASGLLGEEKR